jgi:two-component system phosphate regulon response regulator PhoB
LNVAQPFLRRRACAPIAEQTATIVGLQLLLVGGDDDRFAPAARAFESAGHRVRAIPSGSAAVVSCGRQPPDLLIVDSELPDVSGVDVCRMLRALPGTAELPIVMVSASGSDDDRVAGLEAGADDFLTRPVSERELLLRIERLGRRARPAPPSELVRIDADSLLAWVGGEECGLTLIEFRLLRCLVENHGKALSRAALVGAVWTRIPGQGSRTIDTHMKRLRQKLGVARDTIETVRGVGYRYRAP